MIANRTGRQRDRSRHIGGQYPIVVVPRVGGSVPGDYNLDAVTHHLGGEIEAGLVQQADGALWGEKTELMNGRV